eukprot:2691662-Prymnesium_polylepis.1
MRRVRPPSCGALYGIQSVVRGCGRDALQAHMRWSPCACVKRAPATDGEACITTGRRSSHN